MTFYVPMRDGVAESTMVGLFSDWRDMVFRVDRNLATVLGTMLQIDYALQHHHWTPFNPLRKPERTIVNMQPKDMYMRSQFVHLGENTWRDGDRFALGPVQRDSLTEAGRQPFTVNIEQQDKSTWWILVECGNRERPPKWARHFSAHMRRTLHDFLFDPLALVSRPFDKNMWF